MKERHLDALQRIAPGEKRGRANIACEHVRSAHGVDGPSECLCDRRLDQALLQADTKLADENLHHVASALRIDLAEQIDANVLLLDRTQCHRNGIEIFTK